MRTLLLATALSMLQNAQDLKLEAAGSVRHPSYVRAIAITPDSKQVFIGLDDGALLSYSLETRKPIAVGFRVYSQINGLALTARGDRLAVTDGLRYVTILDASSLKVVARIRLKLGQVPERVVFTPDDESLFLVVSNGHLLKLKGSDLTARKDILPTEGSRILALACSRDGKVATSDAKGRIKLWSGESLEPLKDWKAHKMWAASFSFDPSGKYLVSGGEESALKVWQLSDSSLIKESEDCHQGAVRCIVFTPDGQMVTGGFDGLTQFWDGKSYEAGKSYPDSRGYITAFAVSPDGRWLVRGGSCLDFVPLKHAEEFERVADYGGAILGFAVALDMKSFVTGGLDRRIIFWRIDKEITSKVAMLEDWVTAVEFCNDGRSIAGALANGKIEILAADSMNRVKSWAAHKGRIPGIAIVDGKLVSIGDDAAVHVWDLDGKRLKSYEEQSPCRSVAVHGRRFAVGAANGTFSVHDAATDSLVKRLKARPLSVTALAFSRDGTRLVVGYFDGGLESFDTKSWASVRYRAGNGESVLSISANQNHDLIAVGFRDGYARLYDIVTLNEGPSVQPRPAREIFAIRWILDENTFAVAGASNGIFFQKLNGDINAWTTKIR
jgi:WD40 repeat protein